MSWKIQENLNKFKKSLKQQLLVKESLSILVLPLNQQLNISINKILLIIKSELLRLARMMMHVRNYN